VYEVPFVDKALFKASPAGKLVPTVAGQWAFVPAPLPPKIDMAALAEPLAEAAEALGELNGVSQQLPNPYLLISPLQRREAVSSSNIEGTYSSISDVLMLEAGAPASAASTDAKEVSNYRNALVSAFRDLEQLPLCLRVIRNVHAILLDGVSQARGANIVPGEFKRDQNWIGGSNRDIARARFVPPPPKETLECLDALEKYVQRDERGKPHGLIEAALIHYQFETIHPFPDGNGRVGRILISLFLHERGMQRPPLLYMSEFFEEHKDEYIDKMFAVSRAGEWTPWIAFFLSGVCHCSKRTIAIIKDLMALKAKYESQFKVTRRSALLLKAIDMAFEFPIFSIPEVARRLETTYRGAKQNVDKLVEAKIVKELEVRRQPKLYAATEVLDVLNR
jgi:Fic family protein